MISANVEYGKIKQIKQLPGVADVVLEQQYEPAASENTVQPNMEISTGMTGTTTAWSTGYTGAGMRIAIIDTGLDMSHQSFDNGAYEYALEQNARAQRNPSKPIRPLSICSMRTRSTKS